MSTHRTQHFLSLLMNSPGRYIRITINKTLPHKAARKERRQLFNEVTTALKVLGIKHEVNTKKHYAVKVLSQEEIEKREQFANDLKNFNASAWSTMTWPKPSDDQIDALALNKNFLDNQHKILGKKADLAIIDDLIDNPDEMEWKTIQKALTPNSSSGSSTPT